MSEENITRVTVDPKNPSKGKTDWARVDAMTDEEVHQMALADPDTQPLTAEELERFKRVPDTKAIRVRLNLSQKQFSRTYHIPIRTLQQWEQGRSIPDATTIAFLTAIDNAPEAVREALEI